MVLAVRASRRELLQSGTAYLTTFRSGTVSTAAAVRLMVRCIVTNGYLPDSIFPQCLECISCLMS